MAIDDIASSVLDALGGPSNVLTNTVCMTRLRVTLANPQTVDYEALYTVPSVLGTAARGNNGLEVVFGPAIIDGVYHSFINLTGIAAGTDALFPMSRPDSNLRVTINPAKAARAEANSPQVDLTEQAGDSDRPIDEDDLSILEKLLSVDKSQAEAETVPEGEAEPKPSPEGEAQPVSAPQGKALLVMNGPNLNMLGIREPDLYGKEDYPTMLQLCKDAAAEAGFSRCDCFQSNHEGDLVDVIQDAYGVYDGIVINPGAYTHTSVALLDALKAVSIPAVEVHISHVDEREEFRQVSYIRLACFETISGLGIQGYAKAIRDLAEHLGIK